MIRSVGSIFAAYLICWAPTFCILIAVSWALLLGIDLQFQNYILMLYFVEVLSYVNSLVNPCIYFLSSRSFQRAARTMFHLKETSSSDLHGTETSSASGAARNSQDTANPKQNERDSRESDGNVRTRNADELTRF